MSPEPTWRLRLTPPQVYVAFGLLGLVAGWALRPLVLWVSDDEPALSWLPALLLLFAALGLAAIAWLTATAVQTPGRLEGHRAVNRMVLGKASGRVAALLTGFFAGRALGQVGIASELSGERITRALVAAACAAAAVAAAAWLERACRAAPEDDDDLPS